MLGLHFCARAFSSCGEWGPLFIAVRGPLTITASLVAEHRLQTRRLSSCGSQAQLLRGMRDLPRPGLEPVSPSLAGRLSTTAPPGKPQNSLFDQHFFSPCAGIKGRGAEVVCRAKISSLHCVIPSPNHTHLSSGREVHCYPRANFSAVTGWLFPMSGSEAIPKSL